MDSTSDRDRELALGRLAPAALHEISSSVAGLAGLIELLQLDAEPGSDQAAQLALAAETAVQLRTLLRALAEVAAGDLEQVARVRELLGEQ